MLPGCQQRLSEALSTCHRLEKPDPRQSVKLAKLAILSVWPFIFHLSPSSLQCYPTGCVLLPRPKQQACLPSIPTPLSHHLSVSAALANLIGTKHPLGKHLRACQGPCDRIGASMCGGRETQKERKRHFSLPLGSPYSSRENRHMSRLLIIHDKHGKKSYMPSVGGCEKGFHRR